MILVFGSLNVDLVSRVERIARPGETVLAARCDTHFGGKGANQAVAAAHGSGQAVCMVGAVGSDGFGDRCLANLTQRGVDTAAVQRADLATGMAFISVDRHGENAITVASGANGQVAGGAVPDSCFAAARVCVLQMEVPLAENLIVAERAQAAGLRVVLNFAPAMPDIPRDALHRLLTLCDVLVVNEHEAAVIAAVAPAGAASPRALAEGFDLDVIVTQGAAGADHVARDGRQARHPAPPTKVVDTTGAGDTFVGALAAAMVTGAPLDGAIATAIARASAACGWHGAQPPV